MIVHQNSELSFLFLSTALMLSQNTYINNLQWHMPAFASSQHLRLEGDQFLQAGASVMTASCTKATSCWVNMFRNPYSWVWNFLQDRCGYIICHMLAKTVKHTSNFEDISLCLATCPRLQFSHIPWHWFNDIFHYLKIGFNDLGTDFLLDTQQEFLIKWQIFAEVQWILWTFPLMPQFLATPVKMNKYKNNS